MAFHRRRLLDWVCRSIAAAAGLVVAIPAVRFALDPLRRRTSSKIPVQRVCRLADLAPDEPQVFPIRGIRRDAWTIYPEEVVGRVYVVRRAGAAADGGSDHVDAFSAICPHLGCAVHWDAKGQAFLCPCHKAVFASHGEARTDAELGYKNPTPRDLDRLTCRLIPEEASGDVWVEVEYQRFQFGKVTPEPIV